MQREITGRDTTPGKLKWQGDLQGGAQEAVHRPQVELGTLSIRRHREDLEISGVQSLPDNREEANK